MRCGCRRLQAAAGVKAEQLNELEQFEYLEHIYFDAAGLLDEAPDTETTKEKDYSALGDYQVSNYCEQPHLYAEEDD